LSSRGIMRLFEKAEKTKRLSSLAVELVTLAKVRAELPGRGSGAATILIHSLYVIGP
jgi:hypothetical protein